jgi:hypothetical protein
MGIKTAVSFFTLLADVGSKTGTRCTKLRLRERVALM